MTSSRLSPIVALPLLCAALPCAAQGPSRALNPMAALDEATLKAFVEKPLFEPSRHPPVVAAPPVYVAPPPTPVVEQPPSMRLLGLVEGAHSSAAVVHRNDTGRTQTLHAGDHIGSWLVEIMPAGLRVVSGDRAFDYALFRGGPSQGPVAVEGPSASLAPTVAAREPADAPSR